jgi:hypothetical protein
MKRLHTFSSFVSGYVNESRINESDMGDPEFIKSQCMEYIKETGNNGGNDKLANSIADKILTKVSPDQVFGYFSGTGAASIPNSEILISIFGKCGFLKQNVNSRVISNIIEKSLDAFKFYSSIISQSDKGFKTLKNLATSQINSEMMDRIKMNSENKDEIMKNLYSLLDLSKAVESGTTADLDPEQKQFFISKASEFLSNYENAAKLKKENPELYKEIEAELGDDADIAASLGDVGFE